MAEQTELYNRIPAMSLKEAYKLYMALIREIMNEKEIIQEIKQIQEGIKVKIDIYNIIREDEREESAIKVNYAKETVTYRETIFDLIKYDTEKDERENIIKSRLQKLLYIEDERATQVTSSLYE